MTTTISNKCPIMLEDLINEILSRLPVKTLLRFKSVCKTWGSIINSSYFVNRHYGHESRCTDLLVCRAGFYKVHDERIMDDVDVHAFSLFVSGTLESCVELGKGLYGVVQAVCGPCNGIICVNFVDDKFALWNPATRKLWPIPEIPYNAARIGKSFSFCMDPLTNEFKFFYITKLKRENQRDHLFTYSSSNDSWTQRELPISDDECVQECFRYSVTNGIYYILTRNRSKYYHKIMAYDIPKDLFQEINMPEIEISPKLDIDVDLYGECLALFVTDFEENVASDERMRTEIWVMKEKGCWSKTFSVRIPCLFHTLGFWKGNEIFISRSTELMIYDLVSGTMRNLEIEKVGGTYYDVLFPLFYRESLISVKALETYDDVLFPLCYRESLIPVKALISVKALEGMDI